MTDSLKLAEEALESLSDTPDLSSFRVGVGTFKIIAQAVIDQHAEIERLKKEVEFEASYSKWDGGQEARINDAESKLSDMRDVVEAAKVVANQSHPNFWELHQALDRLEKRDG